MTVKEFIEKLPHGDYTFIIARAEKDEHSPFYHWKYITTCMSHAEDWLRNRTGVSDYIVLNPHHPPIDISGSWSCAYRGGWLNCLVITTEDDYTLICSGSEQRERMLKWYDRLCRNYIEEV